MVIVSRQQRRHVHLTHWGAAEIESDGRRLTSVRPWRDDPAPSRILENLAAAHRHPARVDQPHIRQGWLEHAPGAAGRGSDVFVGVSWNTALDLLATELRRVYGSYGPDGVYGGSYGWASAGRFHHAQSQLHRFLSLPGGYTCSRGSYKPRHVRCAAAARAGRRRRGPARRVILAHDRGEHRADRGLRRHPGEERLRHARRGDPARRPWSSRPPRSPRG